MSELSLLIRADELEQQVARLRAEVTHVVVGFERDATVEDFLDIHRDRIIRTVETLGTASYGDIQRALRPVSLDLLKVAMQRLTKGDAPLRRQGKVGFVVRRRPNGFWVEDTGRYMSARDIAADQMLNPYGVSWRTIHYRLQSVESSSLTTVELREITKRSKARGKGARA